MWRVLIVSRENNAWPVFLKNKKFAQRVFRARYTGSGNYVYVDRNRSHHRVDHIHTCCDHGHCQRSSGRYPLASHVAGCLAVLCGLAMSSVHSSHYIIAVVFGEPIR